MPKPARIKIRLVLIFILLIAILFAVRLYYIQIINNNVYLSRADRQYARTLQETFDRGSIFFQDKDNNLLAVATLEQGYTLAINPQILENKDKVYSLINSIVLDIDYVDFIKKASKTDDPYEEIATRVNQEQVEEIKKLAIKGLIISKMKWRYFPGGPLASHTIGFVGYKGDDLTGIYGIEKYYNDVLERTETSADLNFFAEVFTGIESVFAEPEKQRQGDVILSIEPSVQAYLETILQDVNTEWNSLGTGGIIMDPQNGMIYAMAVYPNFDPNNFAKENDNNIFSNPLIENVFEIGSIMKPVAMSAGLDSGKVTRSTKYTDYGEVMIDGAKISNFDGRGRGEVDMQAVLSESLNTGMVEVVRLTGNSVFSSYMKQFGFGDETGIDLPGETRGLINNLNSPRNIEYATAAFGQGIAVTPIGAIRALSVLANGGLMVTPHVGKQVKTSLGMYKNIFFEPGKRIISENTSREITRMLVEVVDKALLEGAVALPRYSIAAKTGTAQIANPNGGGYYSDRFFHTFFGYFPAFDPRFIVFLYTDQPKGVRYASKTLTLPFMNITKFLLNYYEVAPDR
jgi:stage V sporulation protein D (sporulation-specific penicillin-binding protein)